MDINIKISFSSEDRKLFQGLKEVYMAGQQEVLAAITAGKQEILTVVNAERAEVTVKVTALEEKNTALETTVASLQEQITAAAEGSGMVSVEDLSPIVEALQASQKEQLEAIQGILVSATPAVVEGEIVDATPPPSEESTTSLPIEEAIAPESDGFTA